MHKMTIQRFRELGQKLTMALLFTTIFATPSLSSATNSSSTSQTTPEAIQTLYQNSPQFVEDAYKDLDEDAVSDRLDHCLNSKLHSKVDKRGCDSDQDHDGVFDVNDYCPKTPKGILVNFLGCEGDEDRDGVWDSKDLCPETPYGTKVDKHGCPVALDSDQDGVPDKDDLCPNTPHGRKVNKFGCIPQSKVISHIVFNTGSYEIRSDQKVILEHDASKLRDLKPDEVLLITGYTDNRSCAEGNLKLSWSRAQSTKDFLVKELNLPSEQIYVLGGGESHPIATNDTPEGRQKNRRIALSITPKDQLPRLAKRVILPAMADYVRGYCKKLGIEDK